MLPEPLRLALSVVCEPEYGVVERGGAGNRDLLLDASAVGRMVEVFRSVQATADLTEEEKKQQVWQLLCEMGESPFVQRGSMQKHYKYIVEKILNLDKNGSRKGQQIKTSCSELDRLDFTGLHQFAAWLLRLHGVVLERRMTVAEIFGDKLSSQGLAAGSARTAAKEKTKSRVGSNKPVKDVDAPGQKNKCSPSFEEQFASKGWRISSRK